MQYFDYEKVANECGIPPGRLEQMRRVIRREFPADEMMYELHMLRACQAVRDGRVDLDDLFRSEVA